MRLVRRDSSVTSAAKGYPATISNLLVDQYTRQGEADFNCQQTLGVASIRNVQAVASEVGNPTKRSHD